MKLFGPTTTTRTMTMTNNSSPLMMSLVRMRLLVPTLLVLCMWFTVHQLPLSIDGQQQRDCAVETASTSTSTTSTTITSTMVTTTPRHQPLATTPVQQQLRVCDTRISDGDNPNITAYLSRMEHPEDWLLLKWNADGSFDSAHAQAKTLHQDWVPSTEVLRNINAGPSEFGRVVLLFNSDRIPQVPWDMQPPVPLWVYSKPTSAINPVRWNVSEPIVECVLEWVTVIPSPYDLGNWNRHCVQVVDQRMTKHNFSEKINQVVWRGAVHYKPVEQSRTAVLEYSRNLDTTHHRATVTGSSTAAVADTTATTAWLNVQEVNKKSESYHMELYELANYRYHLDLGGVSGTAWGGLRWKLCTGLLVFKVESWSNDWWYDTLVPWVHYIPIRADIRDLYEQYQWTQNHPEQAEAIATAGRVQCLKTLGVDAAKERYRVVIESIPETSRALVAETDEILEQLSRLDTDLSGLPSIASSKKPK